MYMSIQLGGITIDPYMCPRRLLQQKCGKSPSLRSRPNRTLGALYSFDPSTNSNRRKKVRGMYYIYPKKFIMHREIEGRENSDPPSPDQKKQSAGVSIDYD